MLSRLGLKTIYGLEPVISAEYNDVIRVMYCKSPQKLQHRFRRLMDAMASLMKMDHALRVSSLWSACVELCQ
jgi:hypothetical protein